MNNEADTLHLSSFAGATHSSAHHGSDRNHDVAEDARAKIAAIHAKNDEATLNLPVLEEPLKPTEPVSPALTHQATQAKSVTHHKRKQASKAKPIFIALATFLFLVLLFKIPVIISQAEFLLKPPPTTTPVVSQPVTTAQNSSPTMVIPKINVNVPIIFEPSLDESRIDKALENGVVHYGNTPVPGNPGNSVIVGHSSNDWWEAGNYKFAFVLLDKLVVGDTFSVDYNGTRYIYETTSTKVVEATDLSVLAPTNVPSMTLITCWPVGTNFKRFIVQAKQVSPKVDGTTEVANTNTPSVSTLPGNAPSFTQQITQALISLGDIVTNSPTSVTNK